MEKAKKIIGILGGMGPYATIDIYKKILDSLSVEKERDYPHVIISSNPKMPSRVRAFLFDEESPLSYLISEAQRLEKAGADFLIVACNSAHYYIDGVKPFVDIEILDIVKLTAKHIQETEPYIQKVGVLGTELINRSDLYDKELIKFQIRTIKPHPNEEKILRNAIEAVKHNIITESIKLDFIDLMNELKNRGAEAVVLGCTEFPILLNKTNIDVKIFDPTQILVNAALTRAGYIQPS